MIFGSVVIALVAIAAPLVMQACAAGRIPVNQLAAISFSPALPEGAQSALVVAAAIVLLAALVVGSVFANRAALTALAKHEEHSA